MLGQPVLVHGARASWDQVQQAGRGMILPACQVYDADECMWAPAASVLVVPHVLIDPQHPQPPANTRSPTLNSEEPLMVPEFQKRLR